MMVLEWLVIVVVAFVVFGPQKLPQLATQVGTILRKLNQVRYQMNRFLQTQLQEQQLLQNQQKAEDAEALYRDRDCDDIRTAIGFSARRK